MPAQQKYIFGYGSIIQKLSRERNIAHLCDPIPARVHGFRRSWNFRGVSIGFTCTFLGVKAHHDSTTNGVIVPIQDEEIPSLDKRELGYKRRTIDHNAIDCLVASDIEKVAQSEVMIYETDEPTAANDQFPIIQSYVDICLEGCMEVDAQLGTGNAFTEEFLKTTHEWSSHWVNDRIFPRAPFRYVPKAGQIDRMLKDNFPEQYACIRIE